MQRPSCVRIWPGSSLHCGGWSLRHSPRTRLGATRADAASVLRPDLARQQLALRRRRLAAFATDQVRSARADATSVLRPDLARQQLALVHRGGGGGGGGGSPPSTVRHCPLRNVVPSGQTQRPASFITKPCEHSCHLISDGEGVAGEGLRARPSGGLGRRRHHAFGRGHRRIRRHHADAIARRHRLADVGERAALRDDDRHLVDARFAGSERQGRDAGHRQRRRFRRAAEGRRDLGDLHAFQPRAAHADRVTDADRTGEAGRAAIGDRDLERAGLADLALLVARLLDVDRLRRRRLPHRPRRTDRRCRCRERGPTNRVRSSRSGHRSETWTVTSKCRLVPGVMTAPGIWHDSALAGTGPQAHSRTVGGDGEDLDRRAGADDRGRVGDANRAGGRGGAGIGHGDAAGRRLLRGPQALRRS